MNVTDVKLLTALILGMLMSISIVSCENNPRGAIANREAGLLDETTALAILREDSTALLHFGAGKFIPGFSETNWETDSKIFIEKDRKDTLEFYLSLVDSKILDTPSQIEKDNGILYRFFPVAGSQRVEYVDDKDKFKLRFKIAQPSLSGVINVAQKGDYEFDQLPDVFFSGVPGFVSGDNRDRMALVEVQIILLPTDLYSQVSEIVSSLEKRHENRRDCCRKDCFGRSWCSWPTREELMKPRPFVFVFERENWGWVLRRGADIFLTEAYFRFKVEERYTDSRGWIYFLAGVALLLLPLLVCGAVLAFFLRRRNVARRTSLNLQDDKTEDEPSRGS